MANTLKCDLRDNVTPSHFLEGHADKLRAIDMMRTGHFDGAADLLCIKLPHYVFEKAHSQVVYDFNFELCRASWESYLKAADLLEKEGF